MGDFQFIDLNAPANLNLLIGDSYDGLDQRRVSGSAKSTPEIAAASCFIDEGGAGQTHKHHVADNRIPLQRQDPPKPDRFAWGRVDAKPAMSAGENDQ
jgi:hypothetical protein